MEAKKKSFGYGLYWEVTKQGELIISGRGAIPDYKTGKYKKEGTTPWNQKKVYENVYKIIIEEGITEIGNNAFNGNYFYFDEHYKRTNFREIILPSTLKRIGDKAFCYSSIGSIKLPESLRQMGNENFWYSSVRSIQFPSFLETIGEKNFYGSDLSEIEIPTTWTIIPPSMFYNCKKLTKIKIPSNIKVISNAAFRQCSLKEVIIPEGVEEIGNDAFRDKADQAYTPIETVSFPSTLKKIGERAFLGARIRTLKLPSNLKRIERSSFNNCDNLSKVELPRNIEYIGRWAFGNCDNLSNVTMFDGVEKIESYAFYGCPNLTDVRISQNAICGENFIGGNDYSYYNGRDSQYKFEGRIYCLPQHITESNCVSYGIDRGAYNRYKRGENGIVNSQGKMILSAKSGRKVDVISDNSNNTILYQVTDEEGQGIIADNGKWVVPIVKGRKITMHQKTGTSPLYYEITDKQGKGHMDSEGQWIISPNRGYFSISELIHGQTKYYKVSKSSYGGPYGLLNSNGKEILPTEYSVLESAGGKYLRYKIGDFYGIMNYNGDIVIPTTKGYTSIGNYISSQNCFTYSTYGYKGEVDVNGRELSKIKVETPKPQTVVQKTETPKKVETPQKQEEKKIIIEHKHDPVPMQVWKQCTGCYGSGMCQSGCGGTGWFTGWSGNSTRCIGCGGSGRCQFCAGTGGHYEVEYR